jgi:hypothetical protein
MNGKYTQFQVADTVNSTELIENALKFLELTYSCQQELFKILGETLIQLEDWKQGK